MNGVVGSIQPPRVLFKEALHAADFCGNDRNIAGHHFSGFLREAVFTELVAIIANDSNIQGI